LSNPFIEAFFRAKFQHTHRVIVSIKYVLWSRVISHKILSAPIAEFQELGLVHFV